MTLEATSEYELARLDARHPFERELWFVIEALETGVMPDPKQEPSAYNRARRALLQVELERVPSTPLVWNCHSGSFTR